MPDQDYILCECELEPLQNFVAGLEQGREVKLIKEPAICMTMIEAEDSVEFQPFYLGEALTIECELRVDGHRGLGICLGDEPVRCYCIAFLEAYTQLPDTNKSAIQDFLKQQLAAIELRDKIENELIMRTKVDFKLMEQD